MHWIVLSWLIFGLIHSLLATDRFKAMVSEHNGPTGKQYRLLYNAIALISLIVAVLVTASYSGTHVIAWRGGWLLVPVLAWIVAGVFFVVPALAYDMGQFAGTRAEFRDQSLISTGLAMTWCHRYVRHPWYFAILLVIWARNLNDGWLVANICLTVYLIVGIFFEETRLASRFGSIWLEYRKQVAALIPIPGRSLSRAQLRKIQKSSVVLDLS